MTTDNLVCKTAKIFAVLFLGVLFVTAFTMTNCAWAQTIGGGQDPINPPGPGTDPPIPDIGGEGGQTDLVHYGNKYDTTSMVYDMPANQGPGGMYTSPMYSPIPWQIEWNGYSDNAIIYDEDGKVNNIYEYPCYSDAAFTTTSSFSDDQYYFLVDDWGDPYTESCEIYGMVVRKDVSFSKSINKKGNPVSFIKLESGAVVFEEGAECSVESIVFAQTYDYLEDYYNGFPYNYDPEVRSIVGKFNVDKISVLCGSNFSIDGDITLNSSNDNIELCIDNFGLLQNYKLKVPVLSNSKLTLNKPLVVEDYDDDYEEVTGKGQLLIMPQDDVTLKVCCEAGNSISAESVFISSGRVDIKGAIDGNLEIGEGAEFSPGNSVGTTEVKGDTGIFTLDEDAFLIIEQDADGMDRLIAKQFVAPDDENAKWLRVENASLAVGSEYTIIEITDGLLGDQVNDSYWLGHLEEDLPFYMTLSVKGNSVVINIDHNVIPEPSTWALLVLGAAGMLYWRKKRA